MGNEFKLIQITDTHLFADKSTYHYGINTWQTYQLTLQQLLKNKEYADTILLTGDISHDGSIAAYEAIKNSLKKFNAPVYAINGNHDNPQNLKAVFSEASFSMNKLFHWKNWSFILLDSFLVGKKSGRLSNDELDFLTLTLSQHKQQSIVIILHHHPLKVYGSMDNYILKNREEFLSLLLQYKNVKLVLFGHIHQEFYASLKHIQFIGSPSTCLQLKPNCYQFTIERLGPAYRTFIFNPSGYRSHIKRVVNY